MDKPFVVKDVQHVPARGGTDGVVLTSVDGQEVVLDLEGDCCSQSYFEERSLEEMKSLVGQTLVGIEHVASKLADTDANDDSQILYHALKISTDKQVLTVDWRNESNGYYDGWCNVIGFDTEARRKPTSLRAQAM